MLFVAIDFVNIDPLILIENLFEGVLMRVLIFGATGMLGHAMAEYFALEPNYQVWGVCRSVNTQNMGYLNRVSLLTEVDFLDVHRLKNVITDVRPDIVINCVGVIKQAIKSTNPLEAIPINSLFPHLLANLCESAGARLIHISTDCVFSGDRGMYTESDTEDARDLYGRSKLLGEVDYPHAITLRTSIIGHELNSTRSLIDWFLSQTGEIQGYQKAIFSGVPAVELAQIVKNYVIPFPSMRGLYHVSADPISKYDLLTLVSREYLSNIRIIPNDVFIMNRSLDSSRFRLATGFIPKPWESMIHEMHNFRLLPKVK